MEAQNLIVSEQEKLAKVVLQDEEGVYFAISVSVQVVLEGQVLGVVNVDLGRVDTGGEDVLVVIA